MIMKRIIGIILIGLGILALVYTRIDFTHKEKLFDLGPLQVKANKEKTISWPPVTGAILLVAGVSILLLPNKKKKR